MNPQLVTLIFYFILYLNLNGFFVTASPIVKIKNGTLEGSFMKTRRGREFLSFRGIPYALPPIGDLRFEPPKPTAGWSGLKSANEDAPICTQRNIYTHDDNIVGQEDCLYLNVYTPMLPTKEMKERGSNYPVMIWFHGGGWVTGAGHSEFYNPKFFLDHDVILVTVNFRLGPLGFLSTEDMVSPGNQGMKDQAQSIRWVNENIAAFGGDPNRVTVFGESAGGASTHYHMISPLSRGLFNRGISQSGTALCPWVLTRPGEAKNKATRLGELLNCPTDNSINLVSCLRKKNAIDIIATDRAYQIFDYDPMIPFKPVIEPNHPGAFLNEEPAESLKNGNMADIPWMTGFNSHEGTLKVAGLYGIKEKNYVKQLDENFTELAAVTLMYQHTCPKKSHKDVAKKIRKFYFGNKPIDENTKFEVIDMYSDAWFNVGADMAVRDHLNTLSSPVYYYYLTYKGSSSFSRIFGAPEGDYGVSHADELQYLFPVGEQLFKDVALSEEDHRMIDTLTQLWFNFAKTGNPTPSITQQIPLKWKPVRTEALEYLLIPDSQNLKMSKYLLKERMEFWASIPHRDNVIISKKISYTKDEL
ncbi:venom carboxylesterase-6-like [Microplitis mediator]|uniref:venom carboxylesterase-6-like n=1 Tax=Microplitis mediator TaxID=375433 RepID=UPI0025539545|nr:venom carboxylesterase-6-like [Microplitis mediator]